MTVRITIILVLVAILSSLGMSFRDSESVVPDGDRVTRTMPYRGALLLPNFKTLDELERVIDIEYSVDGRRRKVTITQISGPMRVSSILEDGIDQSVLYEARTRGFLFRLGVVARCPRLLCYQKDLVRTEILARWRGMMFGEGDLAFYDIAEQMVFNIDEWDASTMSCDELSEKGYLNTFNHVTAQAMITSIFSEELADFISDLHERFAMPELITGEFSQEQLDDWELGPTDNYLDMINNEWGQELGKYLAEKYRIDRNTRWTTELLANYLNEIQNYYSWVFDISFTPFRPNDRMVVHYANKLNAVMFDFASVTRDYY